MARLAALIPKRPLTRVPRVLEKAALSFLCSFDADPRARKLTEIEHLVHAEGRAQEWLGKGINNNLVNETADAVTDHFFGLGERVKSQASR